MCSKLIKALVKPQLGQVMSKIVFQKQGIHTSMSVIAFKMAEARKYKPTKQKNLLAKK